MTPSIKVIILKYFLILIILFLSFKGQSESKKSAKRTGPETKGTAMSFGFKKKFGSSSNKKNANNLSNKEKESEKGRCERSATVITNPGVTGTDNLLSDNNGNTGKQILYIENFVIKNSLFDFRILNCVYDA